MTGAPLTPASRSGFDTSRKPRQVELLRSGVRHTGASLAPKASHVATGHAYQALFVEWDWNGWIKPQVDAIASLGMNTVRLIGDFEGVFTGAITQGAYFAHWRQLHDYCAEKSLWLYPAAGGVSQIASASMTVPQVSSAIQTLCAEVSTYQKVLGVDIVQESVRSVMRGSYALSYADEFVKAAKAGGDVQVTFSYSADESAIGAAYWRDCLRPFVDFWDVHVYFDPTSSFVDSAFWNQGEVKPVMIGEYGESAAAGLTAQKSRLNAVKAACDSATVKPVGALAWSVFDQGSGNQAFGLFDSSGAAREQLTSIASQILK